MGEVALFWGQKIVCGDVGANRGTQEKFLEILGDKQERSFFGESLD